MVVLEQLGLRAWVLQERDDAEQLADKLAYQIGKHFRVDVGEHSNLNDPRSRAMEVLDGEWQTDSDQDRRIAELEGQLATSAGGVTGLPDVQPFRNITWPKGREAGRMGDMTPLGESHLRVGFDNDNDVYVSVFNQAHGAGDIEFCTYGQGGGKSPRTREALIALMVAMEEDSKETPSFAFPLGAAIAQEGGK